jgi:hypothetical protein
VDSGSQAPPHSSRAARSWASSLVSSNALNTSPSVANSTPALTYSVAAYPTRPLPTRIDR